MYQQLLYNELGVELGKKQLKNLVRGCVFFVTKKISKSGANSSSSTKKTIEVRKIYLSSSCRRTFLSRF